MAGTIIRLLRLSPLAVLAMGALAFSAAVGVFSSDSALRLGEAVIFAVALIGFPTLVIAALLLAFAAGKHPSLTGVAGALWGVEAFILPRLWIATAYMVGEGDKTDESLGAFWPLARIGFVYLPAIAVALTVPASLRWAIFLLVAVITQMLAFHQAALPGLEGVAPLLGLPATLLLLVGAATSLWQATHRRSRSAA